MNRPEPELAGLGLLSGEDGPVFPAPWAARAFALAVALNERGVFTWSEWAEALGAALRSERGDDPESYWRAWLSALEELLGRHGAASSQELVQVQQAWRVAAERTPHGTTIELGRNRRHLFEFEGDKIKLKDAFRKQAALPPLSVSNGAAGSHEVYRPRRFESSQMWEFGTKRFKLTTISHKLGEPPFASEPRTLVAAKAFAETLLPELDLQGSHFDLGYVVLHQGEAANWLLFDWWISGGITCRLLCRSTLAQPTLFERVVEPFAACVWEAVAIAWERDAWVRTMMSEHPDPEAYLARRLTPGEY